MSESSSLDSLPKNNWKKICDFYVELLDLMPPRIQPRTDTPARIDPSIADDAEGTAPSLHVPRLFGREDIAVISVRHLIDQFAGRGECLEEIGR